MGKQRSKPSGDGVSHGDYIRHRRQRSSSADVGGTQKARNIAPMPTVPAKYKDQRAERISAWARENNVSLSELSRKAKLSRSTAQKVCLALEANLEAGDVGLGTLTALAQAMGRDLKWLLYGDAPPDLVPLRKFPGWEVAAREATEKLDVSQATVEMIGRLGWTEAPPQLDGLFIAGIAMQLARRPRTT